MKRQVMETILDRVRHLEVELEPLRELLLANVIMIGEIPAPTFGEQKRIRFLEQRFTECGLHASLDELGNCVAIRPGTTGGQAILVAAHVDTPFGAGEDHTFTLAANRIKGLGVADNSLGVATLATLPIIMDRLGIELQSDLFLMGSTRSLERGNQAGLRFFLENSRHRLQAAIALEGVDLGRLQFRSMASLGGIVSCHVNPRINRLGAIDVLSQIICRLRQLALPEESHTALILGAIDGGVSYKTPARNVRLRFQLRSDADETVKALTLAIEALLDDISHQAGISTLLDVIVRTRSGGLKGSHPLVVNARKVLQALGVEPLDSFYSAVISGYVEQQVPALCIGLTTGDNVNYEDEYIDIEPLMTGVAQLLGLLMAIDGGCCSEYQ